MKRVAGLLLLLVAAISSVIGPGGSQELKTPKGSPSSSDSPPVSARGRAFPSGGSLRGPAFPQTAPLTQTLPSGSTPAPRGREMPAQPYRHITGGNVLKVGAGGWLVGLDIECDSGQGGSSCSAGTSTKVVRPDTYGAWWFNPATPNCGNAKITGCWQQIINTGSISSSTYQLLHPYAIKPALELRIAPSNTQHFFMLWMPKGINNLAAALFSSANRGTTWEPVGSYRGFNNYNQSYRMLGPSIAIDPSNENIVFVGSPSSGVQAATDGSTFSTVTGLGNSNGPMDLIAFDPSSTSGGHTQSAYVCTQGAGIFHSTNAESGASSTWIKLTGRNMPASCNNLKVDQNGIVWVITGPNNNAGTLVYYSKDAWHPVTTCAGELQAAAVDPYNGNIVYASGGSCFMVSFNQAASFTRLASAGRAASDIPWLQNANEGYLTTGEVLFDPARSNWTTSTSTNTIRSSGSVQTFNLAGSTIASLPVGSVVDVYSASSCAAGSTGNMMQGTVASGSSGTTLKFQPTASTGSGTFSTWCVGTDTVYISEGIGVWYTTPTITSGQTFTYISQSAAIEQLETLGGTSPWGAGSGCTPVPIIQNADRAFFLVTSQTSYPSNYHPNLSGMQPISAGWAVDWQGNAPQNLAAISGQNIGSSQIFTSSNCGATWVATPTAPPDVFGGAVGGSSYPALQIAATTTNNMVIMQGSFGSYYTTDGWNTYHLITNMPSNVPVAGTAIATGNTSAGGTTVHVNTPAWLATDVRNGHTVKAVDLSAYAGASASVASTTDTTVKLNTGGTPGAITSGDILAFETATNYGDAISDKTNDGTFYVPVLGSSAPGAGFYETTNGGATWSRQCAAGPSCPFEVNFGLLGLTRQELAAVPGRAGNLFFSYGDSYQTAPDSNSTLWWSSNAGKSWTQIADVEQAICFGFGKAAPGSDGYPTFYMYGFVKVGGTYTGGFWRAENIDGMPIWTQLAEKFPQGSMDTVITCFGDANAYGTAYLGFYGSGWQVYNINYLLGRDLDPASNDNSPVGLNQAA